MLRSELTEHFKKGTRIRWKDGVEGTVVSKNNHEIYVEWDDGAKGWKHRLWLDFEKIQPIGRI